MVKEQPHERETVPYWTRELNACIKRNQPEMTRYLRFVNWYRGNLSDLIDRRATLDMQDWQASLDNDHTFVTDATIAQMFFRNPKFAIRTPSGTPIGLFTPELAQVEAAYLNDTIEQIGFFRRARRRLLDARNGPYGVLKHTWDGENIVDEEALEAARAEAYEENRAYQTKGPGSKQNPTLDAAPGQMHTAHIEAHRQLLADMQRNSALVPKAAIKHLKKHIEVHEAMLSSERPTETVRRAFVVTRRVNPLDWFYDITVDDIADARWFGHTFLKRKVDVLGDTTYSQEARDALVDSPDRWVRTSINTPAGIPSTGSFDNSDTMVRVHEITDLVDGVVREFFEGGTEMARERRWTMRAILPSGPYSVLMFKPDPIEAAGISPPIAWAAEQHAATALGSAAVSAAIEASRSRGVYNPSLVRSETVDRIVKAGTGEWIPAEGANPDTDIKKAMMDAPSVNVKPETLAVRANVRSVLAQRSGLGAQKSLSGDQAGSATEAAITSGAAEAIARDMGALHDDVLAMDGKMILRLTRKLVPKRQIVEAVGALAQEHYPEDGTWADEDIVNDRNVYVEAGSSRQRDTSIDAKLTMDGIIQFAGLPAMQCPPGFSLTLDAGRRWFDDHSMTGLPWDEVKKWHQMQALLAAQMAADPNAQGGQPGGGEGQPEQEGPAGKGAPPKRQRPSEMTEPSLAGQTQGVANVGGGRQRTGAGEGDRLRMLR